MSEFRQLLWMQENVIRHGHDDGALSNANRADTRVWIEREHTLILFAVAHQCGIPTSILTVAPSAIERFPLIPETDEVEYLTGRNNYRINKIHKPFIP